ncbi:hypothetical protein RclHR1_14050001 [Rhizophagus clarus]|uniref:Uncharacterized protein n=1 Tax=Rhizophagus clarus TaxID=94130 RepID=A0A2Z6QRD0_9GLOM|nr:hypothetical protein RclHR1_14050001 [Rhizophagus clarus]GES83012.1 hypothetical protein GLOIN_2v1734606 [Rhizophagus clarus]
MATFLEQNRTCLKRRSALQVGPKDTVTRLTYRYNETRRREQINEQEWESIINDKNHMLIVVKKDEEKCFGVIQYEAMNKISDIIGSWSESFLLAFNSGVDERKQFVNFNTLYRELLKPTSNGLKKRVGAIAHNCSGMTIRDIHLLVQYKRYRNQIIHRGNWEPTEVQEKATRLLRSAHTLANEANLDQEYRESFAKAIKWLYNTTW